MKEEVRVRAQRAQWYGGTQLLITEGNAVGVHVEMRKREDGVVVDPTITISDIAAQTLMDDLWQAGFRPSEGSGSAGSLRATEKHLEDMRTIAFKALDLQCNAGGN